jgi:hypothetical protein
VQCAEGGSQALCGQLGGFGAGGVGAAEEGVGPGAEWECRRRGGRGCGGLARAAGLGGRRGGVGGSASWRGPGAFLG